MRFNTVVPLLFICVAFSLASAAQKDSIETLLNRDNDWPNLKRFMNENKALQAQGAGENRVVFMGNSITEGWIKNDPGFFAGRNYINRGIGGQTTPQMLLRFRQDVIDLTPKVVVILAGINDIAGNTGPSSIKMVTDNITSMAQLATANGIQVVLCSVLPTAVIPWKPEVQSVSKIEDLNNWLRDFAAGNNFVYVDYFGEMANEKNGLPKELSEDGVHPNKKGYQIMEPIVETGIATALQRSSSAK